MKLNPDGLQNIPRPFPSGATCNGKYLRPVSDKLGGLDTAIFFPELGNVIKKLANLVGRSIISFLLIPLDGHHEPQNNLWAKRKIYIYYKKVRREYQ